MNTLKHITAFVIGGIVALLFMIPTSLFTNIPPINIGIGFMLAVWFPVYGLLASRFEEVK